MKQVYIRRHAPKHSTGDLTEEGKKLAQEFGKQLEKYDLIISSDKPRAIMTAELLTGSKPIIDRRAGIPTFTRKQKKKLDELEQINHYGIAGAILDNLEYRTMIKPKGESLVKLIKETLKKAKA